jgi:hypothetical protein
MHDCADTYACVLIGQSRGERMWERIRSSTGFLRFFCEIKLIPMKLLHKSCEVAGFWKYISLLASLSCPHDEDFHVCILSFYLLLLCTTKKMTCQVQLFYTIMSVLPIKTGIQVKR